MRTRREHGALLYGGSKGRVAAYGGAGGGAGCSLSRGTVVSDTSVQGGRLTASILMDGDEEPGVYAADFAMQAGQRVAVLMFGAQSLVLPIASLLLQQAGDSAAGMIADAKTELEESIDAAGEAIKGEAVKESVAAANGEVKKGIEEFSQTVADTYTTKDEAKSFATSSDLTQTSESLTATFTKSLSEKGKTHIGKPAPPYSAGDVRMEPADGLCYVCTTSRASGTFRDSDWTEHDAFVSAFVRQDYEGVTVGKAESQWKARLSTRGTFDVLDEGGSVATQMGTDEYGAYLTTEKTSLVMKSKAGNAEMSVGDGIVKFSSTNGLVNFLPARASNVPYAFYNVEGVIPGVVCLYSSSSGTTGTVTLREDVTRFWRIDIHFDDGTGRMSVTSVVGPPSGDYGVSIVKNGTLASIGRVVGNPGKAGVYVSGEVVTLTGSTVTRGGGGVGAGAMQANIAGSSTSVGPANHYIKAVVGWVA